MKQRNQMARLCLGAVIAALYTVLTLALPVLSFGPIQFRLAEGMCWRGSVRRPSPA